MTKTITGASAAYSDNWNRIFGKKKSSRTKKSTAASKKKPTEKKRSGRK